LSDARYPTILSAFSEMPKTQGVQGDVNIIRGAETGVSDFDFGLI
jgi:hypothetical protein